MMAIALVFFWLGNRIIKLSCWFMHDEIAEVVRNEYMQACLRSVAKVQE
jgi:hypothetical protein